MSTAPPLEDSPRAFAAPSGRVAFADAARRAALAVDGVVALEPAGLGSGLHETVPGVTVLPHSDGTYRVRLRLVTAMVPLPPVIERVRRAIRHSGRMLADAPVGTIDVVVERVVTAEEQLERLNAAGAGAPAPGPAAAR